MRCSWLPLLLFVPAAWADGGTVRLSEPVGAYRLTVFTSPTPLRAGPVDVSILVQDAATARPAPDARVMIRLTPADRPSHALSYPATVEASTNKLFHSAKFDLPSAGRWLLIAEVEGNRGRAAVSCEVEAGEPPPRWVELWFWIGLPVVPLVLFVAHQVRVRRVGGRSRTAPYHIPAVPET